MSPSNFIPYSEFKEYPVELMEQRAKEFYVDMCRRRSIRDFSGRPVPREIIENCIRTAGTAPSGANMQPWQFVAVTDPEIKQQIRIAAEEEEKLFYKERAPQEWLEAIAPMGTDENKPFLETAPYLIILFEKRYGLLPDGRKIKHYYTTESVGIAAGMFLTAVHNAGLVSLTHTPSPMDFLRNILRRPDNERAFLLIVVGYPAENAMIPDIKRKPMEEIALFI